MAHKKVVMIVGMLLFLMMIGLPLILAAQTQQYAKIFLNPFYKENLAAGVTNNYTLIVVTPDKIASVQNAIFSFNAQVNGQTQNFTLLVNNRSCVPASYMVATAYSTTGNVQFYYDCSNIVKSAGIYTVTLKSAVNTGAIVGWLDLTYTNSPAGLTIHGTEYQVGDPAKIWLQLLDSDKTAIDNATCFMTIYTPNNLKLFSYLQMAHLDNGLYYYDFFAPEVIGVYPVIADCYYITSSQMYNPTNYSINVGNVTSGNLNSLVSNDGDRLKIDEQTASGSGLDFNITFTNVTELSLESNVVLGIHGRWSGRTIDSINIQIWDYNSNNWTTFPNSIPNTGGMDIDTTNTIISGNITALGYLQNKTMNVRFIDQNLTDTDLEKLEIDSLWINLISQSSTGVWANVKGSSEVHVNTHGGHLYTWNTLCDDHNPGCAFFSPSSTLSEGTINETLTVNNIYRTSLQDTIQYETALGLDCTGVLSIIETYEDGRVLDVTDNVLFNSGTQENCIMNIPVTFERTDGYMKIRIVSDNYPKWEVEWAKDVVNGLSPTITDYCNSLTITYDVPMNGTMPNGLTDEQQYCYRAIDDLWYFNNNYILSTSINTIGEYTSYLSESRFYYPLITDHYNHVKGNSVVQVPDVPTIKVMGTDYQIGDNGKIFLQLLQNNNVAINNASCFATVFYPNGTMWQNMAGMTYQTGSSGLYYFNFTAPSTVGIYMVDTICSYTTSTISTNATAYAIGRGWYFGGTGSSLTVIDGNFLNVSEKNTNPGYVNTTVSTLLMGHLDEGNGTTTEDSSANPTNGTHIASPTLGIPGVSGAGVYYPGGSIYTNYAQVSKFNLNSTEAYMVCFSFNESTTNANGNRLVDSLGATGEGFRFSFDGGNQIRFVSDRSGTGAQTLNSGTTYLDSTWHTYCGFANFTTQTVYVDGVQLVTQNVAQSGTMNLVNGISLASLSTGGNYANVALDEVCYMKGTFGTGQTPVVLASAYNTNKQCGIPNSSLDMNVTIPNVSPVDVTTTNPVTYTISSTYLWNGNASINDNVITQLYNFTGNTWFNLPTNLTNTATALTISNTFTPGNISQFLTNRSMTVRYYSLPLPNSPNILKLDQVRLDQTNNVQLPQPINGPRGSGELNIRNYSFDLIPLIPTNVWNYVSRNLTYIPTVQVDYNQIATNVWNFSARNLTWYNMTDTTNYGLISALMNSSIAGIPANINYNLIQAVVWNNTVRNLTYYPTQVDLTNYNLIQALVWNASSRNLTYTPDMTNYTNIGVVVWNYGSSITANLTNQIGYTSSVAVWNYSVRNLTYTPDMTNYNLIQTLVWNATNRNLTYTQDVMNYALQTSLIWNATNRNLTYYPTQFDLTNYTNIALVVWNATTRNLTFYQDVTNYNLIQTLVWNATSRNLTYYPTQVDLTNYTQIQNVVWNASNRSLTYYLDVTNYSEIWQGTWNYTNRNLTYYPVQVDMTNYTNIANVVWNATTRNLTFYPAQVDLTNYNLIQALTWNATNRNLTYYPTQVDMTNYTNIANVVWNASTRTLTFYPDMTNYTEISNLINSSLNSIVVKVDLNQIANSVWNATNRNLTFYPAQLDLTNYTLISELVWSYVSRNLTYTPDMTNYNLIQTLVWNATNRNLTYYTPAFVDNNAVALAVWNFTNRNLTYYNLGNNLAASDVWNYVSRNLTYYEQVDSTNYSLITQNVWSYNNRSLTYYEVNNISPSDIWNFANRSLTQNVSEEVWLYYNRSLTYYPDVSNYSLMANTVWQYVNRSLTQNLPLEIWTFQNRSLTQNVSAEVWTYYNKTLTYYPDVTNYSLINEGIWNYVSRNLTYYADTTNYTLIGQTVWGYPARNLTYLPAVSIDLNSISLIWNYTNRSLTYYEQVDLTNYSLISQMVWNYIDRNLTYTFDVTNYPLIQGLVWNFTDRNLTYYPDTTNYTLNSQMVWTYMNRNLTYYPDNTNYSNIEVVVWNAANRSLTYYPVVDNYSEIAEYVWINPYRNLTYTPDMTNYNNIWIGVWNYTTRNLTYYQINNISTSDIWNYVSRNLTSPVSVDLNSIASSVWNFSIRNLTYYEQVDLTNYTLIGNVVWNFANRNLTYYEIGNNLSASDVWSFVSRNLTYYQDVVNYSYITQNIWSYNNRTLTYYEVNNLSSYDIWNYGNRSLTQNVSEEVWLYYNRTLTYIPDSTNYTLQSDLIWSYANRSLTQDLPLEIWTYSSRNLTQNISYDVWTYYNKTLTYYPDVTNYSLINNGVWTFNNRSLTYYADMTNYTLIGVTVWGYTGTVSPTLLNQVAAAVWNYAGSVAVITNQVAYDVWHYSARYTHGEILD